jgi:predicted nucleic acid-binding OB-fold protein
MATDPNFTDNMKTTLTLFQIVKNNNEVTITNEAKQIIQKIQNIEQLKSWIAKTYPDFLNQIEQKIYTKFPHPNDILE